MQINSLVGMTGDLVQQELKPKAKCARVLIVEDERIIARDLQATLRRAGYEAPVTASSGGEAIRLAQDYEPDVVLMDIVLQGEMDGITAAGHIRRELGIPVIYLSSYGDPSTIARAKATEPIGYVLKPYEETELLTTVDVVLHQFRASRHRARTELLNSEARFRGIFESAAWGIALVDRDGWVVEHNGAWGAIYAIDGFERQHLANLLHADDRAQELNMCRELFEGTRASYQLAGRTPQNKEGMARKVRCIVTPFPRTSEKGAPEFALRMVEDITEEEEMREQLLRAQRMETIGTLSSSLAHNLSNLLLPAMMGAEMLRESVHDHDSRETLGTLEKSLQRAAGIIRQLLNFGRGGKGNVTLTDLPAFLEEMRLLLSAMFPRNIKTVVESAPGTDSILADPNELHQAVLNLCTNAQHAMPHGGTLTIQTVNVQADAVKANVNSASRPEAYVQVSIRDTGVGMSREVLERIFEPFFTTKPIGQGTGLGLMTTLGVVKRLDGFIDVESEPGRGTCFKLYFPSASKRTDGPGKDEDLSRR